MNRDLLVDLAGIAAVTLTTVISLWLPSMVVA